MEGLVDEVAQDGLPLLDLWSTAIWADDGEQIRGGGILVDKTHEGGYTRLEVAGVSAYPAQLPWAGTAWEGIQVDPLDVLRRCWADVQGAPGGNLGVVVDGTTSQVRLGEPGWWEDTESGAEVPASAVVWNDSGPESRWRHHEAQPVELSWWAVPNVGAMIDRMVDASGADWLEETTRVGATFSHRIHIGSDIGVRRTSARLVAGENVVAIPTGVSDGSEWASEVQVRGAGEGAEMVRASASRPSHRLRRVAVVSDRGLLTDSEAASRARQLLPNYSREIDLDSVRVIEHANAGIWELLPGDSVPLIASGGALSVDGWVRIQSVTYTPEATEEIRLTVTMEES